MSPLRKAVAQLQNPLLSAPLFWALTKGPATLREPLLNLLGKVLSPVNVARFINALKWTFYIGIASKINQALNDWATNNWQWKSEMDKWDFKREVAVVTGGCSGIGLEIVKGLMRKGVRVAVFDVQSLPKEIENCEYPPFQPQRRPADKDAIRWEYQILLLRRNITLLHLRCSSLPPFDMGRPIHPYQQCRRRRSSFYP